jgi:hypothetical protein
LHQSVLLLRKSDTVDLDIQPVAKYTPVCGYQVSLDPALGSAQLNLKGDSLTLGQV